jgi:hypothetical protein
LYTALLIKVLAYMLSIRLQANQQFTEVDKTS